MDVNFTICGSIGSEIKNRCFVVVMCLQNQPRWRRLETIVHGKKIIDCKK